MNAKKQYKSTMLGALDEINRALVDGNPLMQRWKDNESLRNEPELAPAIAANLVRIESGCNTLLDTAPPTPFANADHLAKEGAEAFMRFVKKAREFLAAPVLPETALADSTALVSQGRKYLARFRSLIN